LFGLTLWTAFFLPLLAPSSLLLLLAPSYVMGLSGEAQRQLYYYYSYPFLPFMWLGASWAIARLVRHVRLLRPALSRWLWVGIVATLFVAGAWMMTLSTRTDGKRRVPPRITERHHWIREQLREQIPPDASVAAQFDLLCQVPYRLEIYPLSEESITYAEYWVLDLHPRAHFGDVSGRTMQSIVELGKKMVREGRAEIVARRDGFMILRWTD